MTLEEIYKAAWEDDVFFAEYNGMPVAAGDRRDLEWLATNAEPTTTPEELLPKLVEGFMGAIIDLCCLGKVKGTDRVANCQSAWDEAKRCKEKGILPRVIAVRKELGLTVGEGHQLGTF